MRSRLRISRWVLPNFPPSPFEDCRFAAGPPQDGASGPTPPRTGATAPPYIGHAIPRRIPLEIPAYEAPLCPDSLGQPGTGGIYKTSFHVNPEPELAGDGGTDGIVVGGVYVVSIHTEPGDPVVSGDGGTDEIPVGGAYT